MSLTLSNMNTIICAVVVVVVDVFSERFFVQNWGMPRQSPLLTPSFKKTQQKGERRVGWLHHRGFLLQKRYVKGHHSQLFQLFRSKE